MLEFDEATAWRQSLNLHDAGGYPNLYGNCVIRLYNDLDADWREPDRCYPEQLRRLLRHIGKDAPDLNSSHPKATRVYDFEMDFYGVWRLDVRYGYPGDDKICWNYRLVKQSPGETFSGLLRRANEWFYEVGV